MKIKTEQARTMADRLTQICNAVCHVDHDLDSELTTDDDAIKFLRTLPSPAIRELTDKTMQLRSDLIQHGVYQPGPRRKFYHFRISVEQGKNSNMRLMLGESRENIPWPCLDAGPTEVFQSPVVDLTNVYASKLLAWWVETKKLRGLYHAPTQAAVAQIKKCNTVGQIHRLLPESINYTALWPSEHFRLNAQREVERSIRSSQLPTEGKDLPYFYKEAVHKMLAMHQLMPVREVRDGNPALEILGEL